MSTRFFDKPIKYNFFFRGDIVIKKNKIKFISYNDVLIHDSWLYNNTKQNNTRNIYIYSSLKNWVEKHFSDEVENNFSDENPMSYNPTVVMEIGYNKYIFVLKNARYNENNKYKLVFDISTKEINSKITKKIPKQGTFKRVRFDIDSFDINIGNLINSSEPRIMLDPRIFNFNNNDNDSNDNNNDNNNDNSNDNNNNRVMHRSLPSVEIYKYILPPLPSLMFGDTKNLNNISVYQKVFNLQKVIPIWNQGRTGTCCTHSAGYLFTYIMVYAGSNPPKGPLSSVHYDYDAQKEFSVNLIEELFLEKCYFSRSFMNWISYYIPYGTYINNIKFNSRFDLPPNRDSGSSHDHILCGLQKWGCVPVPPTSNNEDIFAFSRYYNDIPEKISNLYKSSIQMSETNKLDPETITDDDIEKFNKIYNKYWTIQKKNNFIIHSIKKDQDTIVAVLDQGYPITFAMIIINFETERLALIDNTYMKYTTSEKDISELKYCHAVVAVGCIRLNGEYFIYVRNSWGVDFGQMGYFWMPMSFLLSKYCAELLTISLPVNLVDKDLSDKGLDFSLANFTRATLENVNFSGNIITNVDFIDAKLTDANFTNANLTGTNFTNANLEYAKLSGANIAYVNFTNANLSYAKFSGVLNITSQVNFTGTKFFETDFTGTNLRSINFTNAILGRINFENTDLSYANFTGVQFIIVNFTNANLTDTFFTGANFILANLTNANLSGKNLKGTIFNTTNLTGVNLRNADLTNAEFKNSDLINKDLTDVILTNANLIGANLTNANLTNANLTNANLTNANLTNANLTGTNVNITNANLTNANLTGANLTNAILIDANLTGADLSGADLTGVNLTNTILKNANLTGATLSGADLTGAKLSGANLTGAKLSNTILKDANLIGAKLIDANLTNANLTNANFEDANLTNAILTGANFTRANLKKANLTTAKQTKTANLNFTDANLTNANLTNVKFDVVILRNAILNYANLNNATLTGANLTDVILTNANLIGANLTNANLTNAILTNAILTNAILTNANLTNANLTNASILDAKFTNANLTNANLTNARGITYAFFNGAKFNNTICPTGKKQDTACSGSIWPL